MVGAPAPVTMVGMPAIEDYPRMGAAYVFDVRSGLQLEDNVSQISVVSVPVSPYCDPSSRAHVKTLSPSGCAVAARC